MYDQVRIGVVLIGYLIACAAPTKARPINVDARLDKIIVNIDYTKDSDELFGQIKALYFAIGCKVVPGEASLTPYIRSISGAFEARARESGVHTNETGRMKQAAREGMAKAKEASACGFWRQHPEMARGIRTIAKTGR